MRAIYKIHIVEQVSKHQRQKKLSRWKLCPTTMQNVASKKAIYDIGTEILKFQGFCTMETLLFSKPTIFSVSKTPWPVDYESNVKTPFQAIF